MIDYAILVFKNVLYDLKYLFKKMPNGEPIKDPINTGVSPKSLI